LGFGVLWIQIGLWMTPCWVIRDCLTIIHLELTYFFQILPPLDSAHDHLDRPFFWLKSNGYLGLKRPSLLGNISQTI
jgi:hypothetical protein